MRLAEKGPASGIGAVRINGANLVHSSIDGMRQDFVASGVVEICGLESRPRGVVGEELSKHLPVKRGVQPERPVPIQANKTIDLGVRVQRQ